MSDPKLYPKKLIEKKHSPRKKTLTFSEDLKKKIRLWVQQKIMQVVMTPGGGLYTQVKGKPKPKKIYPTFENYLMDVVNLIEEKFPQIQNNTDDYSEIDMIEDIFPMFHTETNDTTCVKMYEELEYLISSNE